MDTRTKKPKQDPLERCIAALQAAWIVWRPVIAAVRAHDVDGLGGCVDVATSSSSTERTLMAAAAAWKALPAHASPPPYAGHFYGAVHELLLARIAVDDKTRASHLRKCRSFCNVAPDVSKMSLPA